MRDRLAPATRVLLRRAEREAAALEAHSILPEHLLIAALDRHSPATQLRDSIAPARASLALGAEAKQVLTLGLREALAQGHRQIQPTDVLLALAEHGGVQGLLDRAGLSLNARVLEARAQT